MGGPILLAGATGLVGAQLARLVPPERLVVLSRRPVDGLPDTVRQVIAAPEVWANEVAKLNPAIAISTLGTTIRKAGSQAAFRAVDHDLVVDIARAACASGARQFLMVSSVGADATSRNFYLSVKGQAEDAVRAAGFARVDVLRPGLLRGARQETRTGEHLAILASPLTDFLTPAAFDRYRSIDSGDVARAAMALCDAESPGPFVHHNREMWALARRS